MANDKIVEVDIKTGTKTVRDMTAAEQAIQDKAAAEAVKPKTDDQYVTLGEVKALIASSKG